MVQSRLSVRDGAVGYWWRPDACAAGSPTQTAPRRWYRRTERSVGPTVSLQWAKQALFPSLTLPPFTYTCTRIQDIRHTDTHTYNATVIHAHKERERETHIHRHVRTYILSPPTSCESLHPPNDTRGSPSSWLVPHGCSAFPNTHETTSNYSHARTHAHGVEETRGRTETFPRLLVVLRSRWIGCWTARHATVSLISTQMP